MPTVNLSVIGIDWLPGFFIRPVNIAKDDVIRLILSNFVAALAFYMHGTDLYEYTALMVFLRLTLTASK